MPSQPSHGTRRGGPGRATERPEEVSGGIKSLVAAMITTVAVVAFALPATGAAVVEAGNPRTGALIDPSETQRAIVDAALRNGAVPPELALAVAWVARDHRYAAGDAGYAGRFGGFGLSGDHPRDIRRQMADLERLFHRYRERWDLALSHYYGGPLAKCGEEDVSHIHTTSRVADTMAWWRRFQEDPAFVDLVRRTRAMQERGTRFAALGGDGHGDEDDGDDGSGNDGSGSDGGGGAAPGTNDDASGDRPEGRPLSDRGGWVTPPFAPERFRSDNRPIHGVTRAGRFF